MSAIKSFLKNNWLILLILGIIVVWGGFLRLYNIGEQSLWIDEGYTINASQGILEHGYPLLDSGIPYKAHPLHNYLTAGSMKLFGFDAQNPWSARLPAALFGILSILATFFFTKRVTKNNIVALTAAFLMAFSYWEIAWSRQARGYTDMQFFILLSFTFFYQWLDKKNIKNGLLTILFLILSYASHGVALIFIPAFFILFLIHSIWSGNIEKKIPPVVIGFFVLLTGFGIWIAINFLPTITTFGYAEDYLLFFTRDLKFISILTLTIFFGIFLKKNVFWQSIYSIGILAPTIIIIMFYSQVIQMRYLLTIFPFLLIGGAYGSYLIITSQKFLKPILNNVLYVGIVISIVASSLTFLPKVMYNLEIGSPQPDFKQGYAIIKKLQKENDIIISPYTHLSKIYLDNKGFWLPISLTGRASEITRNTINGTDYYTGAPIISDRSMLEYMLSTVHGYIIIDDMAKSRLRETFTYIINHPSVVPVYYIKNSTNESIAIYQFNPKNIPPPLDPKL